MEENIKEKQIFTQRIDTYGRALAIYVVVFVVFSIIYGTLHDGEFRIVFSPLVIVMFGIMCVGTLMLLIAAIKRKQIIIETNVIEIKNRFHSVKFSINDIKTLVINKTPIKDDSVYVKIKLKYKRKIMLIRVGSFDNSNDLTAEFSRIMKEYMMIREQLKKKRKNI